MADFSCGVCGEGNGMEITNYLPLIKTELFQPRLHDSCPMARVPTLPHGTRGEVGSGQQHRQWKP